MSNYQHNLYIALISEAFFYYYYWYYYYFGSSYLQRLTAISTELLRTLRLSIEIHLPFTGIVLPEELFWLHCAKVIDTLGAHLKGFSSL